MVIQSTAALYLGLVVLVALQRCAELVLSRRNMAFLKAQGGVESGAGHYPWMMLLHILFLVACPLEVVLLERPFVATLGYPMLGVLLLAGGLRVWAINTLGQRWTTRIVTLDGAQRILQGPYRYAPHPNYLAVILEIVALPLIHSAWISAIVFSLANAVLLRVRIQMENAALVRAER